MSKSKVKQGIDFDKLSLDRLKEMLYAELFIDIDSSFADEIRTEIERRETALAGE
jgi:hypothetical protein